MSKSQGLDNASGGVGASASIEFSALKRGPAWAWGLLGLLLFGLWLGFSQGRSKMLSLTGSPDSWTEASQKKILADYLNAQVTLPGYKAFCVQVAKKENYWSIARKNDISIDTIVGLNPDLASLSAYVGRALLVANKRGSLYFVQAGDSLQSIEKEYECKPGLIKANNRVGWMQALRPGQVLLLPGVKPKPLNPEMADIYKRRSLLRSPLAGHYTSLLGTRIDPFTGEAKHHNGVDIKAPFNSLVAAAADGTVTLAGWNGGFGKCVVIEHADGLRTLYGHLNTVLVHVGQKVKQYHFIGRVGATGRTTGPHLHFTIWKDGKLQDPLKYLW
jgi:murein DD-endopeptidase MepM/ murein hydrolase activator NlpD